MNKRILAGVLLIVVGIIGICIVAVPEVLKFASNISSGEVLEKITEFYFLKEDDKYHFIPYQDFIANLPDDNKLSLSGISIASTKISDEGFLHTDSNTATLFFYEYSDLFYHPYFSQVVKEDATVFIVSSDKFDPLCNAYPETYYDEVNNAIYFVFEKSHEHTLMFDEEKNKDIIDNVTNNSKATYTLLYLYEEDLDKYDNIYFTVSNEF